MNKRRSFITGIKSTKLNKQEINFLRKYKPWGVILFSRNLNNFNQIKKLTTSIKKIFKDNNYPIMIDQEGGRVNRLHNLISLDNLTSEYFGKIFIKEKKKFNLIYKLFIDKISNLLLNLGININTVPVLDLRYKGSSNIIGDRSFSKNPKIVSQIGKLCIKYFKNNSIGTVIKHIPGHGLAKVDSHYFTPTVSKDLNYLKKNDFKVFETKNSLFAMTAHVIYKKIDPDNTVTHSQKLIKIIRNQIKFKNLIITDDLSMKSLKYSLAENTKRAFDAGCNLALHCNGNIKEMTVIAENSPIVNSFIIKKTSECYNNLSYYSLMNESINILFEVDVEYYNGPLDVLLDLAKAQKVNLEEVSITKLADQFYNYISNKKNLNLEVASEYLLMATWLAYLKSKLLLPGTPDEDFKVQEVAERLKLQLKKLELIRLLSDQMLKRKRLGREIRTRGIKGNIRSIYSPEYRLNLFELLKAYSSILMTKDFQKMNIPKLPVFTTEEGIKTIKDSFGKLVDWKKLDDLIPINFKSGKRFKRTGKAGIFAGSLELVKEGNLKIKQDKLYEDIYIKEN